MNRFSSFKLLFILLLLTAARVSYAERKDILYSLYSADFSTNENAEITSKFTLNAELGANFTSGNSENSTFNGRLLANHDLIDWSNRYLIEAAFAQTRSDSETNTTAERFNVSVEADYKLLDPNRRIFMFADYEDDQFDGFESQSSFAVGWAKVRVKSESSSFRYSIGPGYNYAKPIEPEDDDPTGLIVRASVEYIYQWSTDAKFRQALSTEIAQTTVFTSSETSITTKVLGPLSMQVSLVLDHSSAPGSNIEKLDTRSSVSLVYQFF